MILLANYLSLQWVEDYVNQTIKSGMVQWRILSVREDEK